MQKEAIHQLIVKLTLNKDWLNDPVIVNQVKLLGDQLSCTRRSPINYNQIQGIIVYYLDGSKKVYTSLKVVVKEKNSLKEPSKNIFYPSLQ